MKVSRTSLAGRISRFAACIAFGLTVAGNALSQTTPSTKIGTAPLVNPQLVGASYGTSYSPRLLSGTAPKEIVELARALGSYPTDGEKVDQVYRYVRDNIEIAWMFGLQKGALGAIVDRSGTAFDQAQLMVDTLRSAGVTASYQFGTITLTGAQFASWSGVTDATAACQLLSSGGIPASINGGVNANCTYGAVPVSTITLSHVWVRVTFGGTDYVFDPAYKPHTFKARAAGLAGIITPGQPLGQSVSGMEQGANYVRSLNKTALEGQLMTYANAVQGVIQGSYADGEIEDIVGGAHIVRSDPAASLRQTSLAYATPVGSPWTGQIPDDYRTKLSVKANRQTSQFTPPDNVYLYAEIFNKTFFIDEIYGYKLTIIARDSSQLTANPRDVLRVVDEFGGVLFEQSYKPPGEPDKPEFNKANIELKVDHPYPGTSGAPGVYMDETVQKSVTMWMPLTIVTGFGDVGRGLIDKWGARSDTEAPPIHPDPELNTCGGTDSCSPYAQTSGDARREQLAASWLSQSSRAAKIHANLSGSIYSHHHSIGVVAGDTVGNRFYLFPMWVNGTFFRVEISPNYQTPTGYRLTDSFDRVDVNSSFSLTNKTANALDRRAAVHAVAQTLELLEGSVSQQISDLPDTTSVSTRFAWGNLPPANEDNLASGTSPGPRRFYSFLASAAAVAPDITRFEGYETSSGDGQTGKFDEPEPSSVGWRAALHNTIKAYGASGFDVVASEESFLGPGQRGGAQNQLFQNSNVYGSLPTFQRGGALVATKYVNGEPIEIAHVVVGVANGISKGGGGGAQPNHQATYNPGMSADVLKSRFVDRSSAAGVDLEEGSLTYESPVGLEVGQGEFPDKLPLQIFWRGGETNGNYQPPGMTAPQAPWSTNWHNTLTTSGSGMEAMGVTDVRGSAGTVAAFLAMQDVYRAGPSPQREVTAALIGAWWGKTIADNIVTVTVGSKTQQFVRRHDNTYFTSGPGAYATLARTGPPRVEFNRNCTTNTIAYTPTRGWKYANVGYVVTNAGGDTQTFSRWESIASQTGYCGILSGFRLSNWSFKKGVDISFTYATSVAAGDRLTKVANSLGREINFIYSSGNELTGFSDGTRTVSLGGNSPFVTHTDAGGKTTTFTQTTFGGWPEMTGAGEGGGSGYRYRLTEVQTPDDATPTLRYTYDSMGRVKEARDRLGVLGLRSPHQFLIGHGLHGERIDPAGGRYVVDYDEDKKAVRFVDEIGRAVTAAYDGRGRTTAYTYPEGDQEVMAYDDRNNQTLMRKVGKPGTGEAGQQLNITANWDATWNKIASLTDAKGQTTTFTYVPLNVYGAGELATAVRPNGAAYGFNYNAYGQPLTSTDPTGVVTAYGYDANNYLTTTTLNPTGVNAITTLTNNVLGDPIIIDGPRTDVSDISYVFYDSLRRKEREVGPATVIGNRTAMRTTYDTVGRVTKTEQGYASGAYPTFSFTPVITSDSVYDAVGNKVKETTPAGLTQVSYDALNRTLCTARRMNGEAPDACLPGPQGALGQDQVSKNAYDLAGQLVSTRIGVGTDAETAFVTKAYTPNGQVQFLADGSCNVTKLAYDGFDRLKVQYFPLMTPRAGLQGEACVPRDGTFSTLDFETYGYDANGNQTSLLKRDQVTSISTTFDVVNRKTFMDVSGSTTQDVYYTYDAADRLTSARYDSHTGKGIIYGYDTAGRLVSDKSYNWAAVAYEYDQAGNRRKITWPDGQAVEYVFDAANRMTTIREPGATTQPGVLVTFDYDNLGRRTSLTRGNTGAGAYAYDTAGRLTTLNQSGGGASQPVSIQTISYTPASQIRTLQQATPAYVWQGHRTDTKNAAYDGLNRDAAIAVLTSGYDKNGNLTNSGTHTYSYDAGNRLTLTGDGTASMGIAWDPLGRLRATQTSAGLWTYFLYSGDQMVGEYALNTAGAPALRRYVHGPGVDEPLVWYEGSGVADRRWLHADRQGSIIGVSNGAGAVTPYAYGPWGEPSDWTGPRFRYTGQATFPEAQAYHYKARVYDPAMGRFLQTDPIGQKDDPNLYAYVKGDPVNKTDPTGECPMCAGAIIGGVFGGGLEIVQQMFVEHRGVSNLDVGRVALQTGIGAVAGATGVGAGALVERAIGATVLRGGAALAGSAAGGAVSGGGAAAANGESPANIARAAALGAIVGGSARVVAQGGSAVLPRSSTPVSGRWATPTTAAGYRPSTPGAIVNWQPATASAARAPAVAAGTGKAVELGGAVADKVRDCRTNGPCR